MKSSAARALLAGLLLGLTAWALLPWMIRALPGPLRYRLPDPVLALVTTPLPAALPRPQGAKPNAAALLADWPAASPTPLPALPPTFTPAATPAPPTAAAASPVPPTTAPLPASRPPAAAPAPATDPDPSADDLPPATSLTTRNLPGRVFIQGVPVIPQKFNNCGPTNLAQVLHFYGQDVSQLDVAAAIRPTYEDRNVSPWQIVDYAQNRAGLRAQAVWGGDLTLLQQLLAAGFPVLVEKGLVPNDRLGWMGHYLTLVGYDVAAQQLWGMDTFLGPWDGQGRPEPVSRFQAQWQQFNYALIVVFPAAQTETVTHLLGPAATDPAAMWTAAARRARRELTVEPANAFAWFNLGSSLTRLGQLDGDAETFRRAAAAFDQARVLGLPWRMLWYQFEPYEAYLAAGRPAEVLALTDAILSSEGGRFVEESYLYQGLALQALGDEAAALAAWRRARQVNPGHPAVLAALAAADGRD